MATTWTEDQLRVIETRDSNLLVSAAAGSGKTAVLVERIIQRITDQDHPIDIDELLVVTFTSAAAAEMRERIRDAVERALDQDGDNPHLLRQMTLVHNAQITTIHSFCMNVIRNHFHEIDLDPGFRIVDEGENRLLMADTMDALMKRHYEEEAEGSIFFSLVDAYGKRGRDTSVTEMILDLYEKAQSYPWPGEWLKSTVESYRAATEEELAETPWMEFALSYAKSRIGDAREQTAELVKLCQLPEGPGCYLDSLTLDLEIYDRLMAGDTYGDLARAFRDLKFPKIGNSRGFTGDPELLEQVKSGRDACKKAIGKLAEDLFFEKTSEVLADMAWLLPYMEELALLGEEFGRDFARVKRKKNLLDYGDLEHMALEILVDSETKELRPAALEYQRQFAEVMIDEYQDSNYIQEAILTSVSRESAGGHNRFMVGDVKQSIYRFRLACPQIFMDKYAAYSREPGAKDLRIDLHMNFRSRREVLDFVNDIFYPLMRKDIGNVLYDDQAALYVGAQNYREMDGMFAPEILVGDFADVEDPGEEDRLTYEAKIVADRILDMKRNQMVTDKSGGQLRPVRFSDIVILMRSPGSGGETFVEVLRENGIPAFMESRTGYFTSTEVETVLSLLKILDNPYWDIPLTAVLHSPMFGFTDRELAEIRGRQEGSFAHVFFDWARTHSREKKVEKFLSFYDRAREKVADTPIHRLLEFVLEETGYLDYVTAMPAGAGRRANLEKLVDQAVAYEQTSYKGLFHFVRYIEHLQKYEVDFGAAELISENDDAVRIMSIHKSKGLEFPVVFVSALGRQFNRQDSRGRMVVHSDYGVGLEYVDDAAGVRKSTLYKKAVERAITVETLGEEMRVLYVALTRAKEKLVLTGVCKDAVKELALWRAQKRALSYTERLTASCFLEWVVRCASLYPDRYKITVCTPGKTAEQEASGEMNRQRRRLDLLRDIAGADADLTGWMEEQMTFAYPFEGELRYKAKYSVSEIKHRAMEALTDESSGEQLFSAGEEETCVPQFISGKKREEASAGALLGTAVHRVLECLDFTREPLGDSLEDQIRQMEEDGRLLEDQVKRIPLEKVRKFLGTSIAGRMAVAAAAGCLFLEQPFVMGDLPEKIFGDGSASEEMLLVQGIIDVFFEEEDGIVLLDYKTDRVREAEELIRRYRRQLELYGEALERTRGKRVKERYLYSFALGETIRV